MCAPGRAREGCAVKLRRTRKDGSPGGNAKAAVPPEGNGRRRYLAFWLQPLLGLSRHSILGAGLGRRRGLLSRCGGSRSRGSGGLGSRGGGGHEGAARVVQVQQLGGVAAREEAQDPVEDHAELALERR